jgi:hypothetical protein
MSEELKEQKPLRIVAAMKKPACFLLFLLLAAPAFAQSQQFGILFGGTKRLYSGHDKEAGIPDNNVANFAFEPPDRIRLNNGAREVFWAVQVEPSTYFRIQAGQWKTDVGIVQSGKELSKPDHPVIPNTPARFPASGTVQHVDGTIDYRFDEPFGTTGLFAGLGLYRWSAPQTPPDDIHNIPSETNYGYTFGVNGEFPITKRYAFMVEGAYHWINMSSPVRYVTVTGGVRIGF